MPKRRIIYESGDIVGGYKIIKMLKPYSPPKNPRKKVQKAKFMCLQCGVKKDCIIYKVNTGSQKLCKCWKNKEVATRSNSMVDSVVKSITNVGTRKRNMESSDVGQADKLLKEIMLNRQGKTFRLIKIDRRTWKEVEIK